MGKKKKEAKKEHKIGKPDSIARLGRVDIQNAEYDIVREWHKNFGYLYFAELIKPTGQVRLPIYRFAGEKGPIRWSLDGVDLHAIMQQTLGKYDRQSGREELAVYVRELIELERQLGRIFTLHDENRSYKEYVRTDLGYIEAKIKAAREDIFVIEKKQGRDSKKQ